MKSCISLILIYAAVLFGNASCSKLSDLNKDITDMSGGTPDPVIPAAELDVGTWIPNLTGGGSGLKKGTVTVTRSTSTVPNVGMVRFQDSWSSSKEITVNLGYFDATNDFGYSGSAGNGSLTLIADAANYPISGGAYPVLTSLYVISGGTKIAEFVNLHPDCQGGIFACAGGVCDLKSVCTVSSPSGFKDGNDWIQHNTAPFGYTSVNSFPRCDPGVGSWSWCSSALKTLPSGNYYAKYLLLSDSGLNVSSKKADLNVEVMVRKDTLSRNDSSTPSNGVFNLNVILVGDENINDSHTTKGALNLNLLFSEVNRILSNASDIAIGTVKVYEWKDIKGGDQYSQIFYDDLGTVFAAGSKGIPAEDDGNAINVFMLRDIAADPSASYTILGIAGGIMAPTVNGKLSSGLAFSTSHGANGNGLISDYNPASCNSLSCSRNNQDGDFLEMAATIAHELGHFLGLNHPSETVDSLSKPQEVDQMTDTPTCKPRGTTNNPILDQRACYLDSDSQLGGAQSCQTSCDANIPSTDTYYDGSGNKTIYFCPAIAHCQFNHLMWYTTKLKYHNGTSWSEDGNQVSPQSSALIQLSPLLK